MDHPTLADGRYVVQRCIGHGGMAAVFLVYDNTFKAARAIKVLKPSLIVQPESRMRFRTEAIAMARLNHPHIVRVFDQGTEGMTSYIVMEYFPHGSLQAYLRTHGTLPREVALSMTLDLTDALAHAHQTGVIHRDVKPDNILLSPEGGRLTDFGLARISAMSMGMTRTRAVIGTPSYMSPEQRISTKRSSHLADIYALTATLFSMLSNEDPIDLYDGDAQDSLLDPLDADIAAIIRKGCHADQSRRFQSAAEVAAAVEALRGTPHAPRVRITPLPLPTDAPPVDISNLRRLWASYTSPSQDQIEPPAKSVSATISVDQLDQAHQDAPQATVAGASSLPPQPTAASWRRPVGAALLLLGVLGVGAAAWQATPGPVTPSLQLQLPKDPQDRARLDEALASLLDADLQRARLLLAELVDAYPDEPAVHSALGMLLFLQDHPQRAASAAHRAAVISQDRADHMSQMMVLADPLEVEQSEAESLRARWMPLRTEAAGSPAIDLLYLVSTWALPDKERQKQELSAARERHPGVPVFALLDVVLHHETARTHEEHANLMARLDASLSDFPDSAMLLLRRGQLLLMRGEVDAAAEVLSQVARIDESLIEVRIHQSTIAALRDDEAERTTQLLTAVSDLFPPDDQRAFLLESGLMGSGLGQPALAERSWRLGIEETDHVADDQQRLAFYVPILETMLAGHEETTETWRTWMDISRQCLRDAELDEDQKAVWASSLTYMEAVRAARLGQRDRASAMLAELEAYAAQSADLQRSPSHVERLRLELALVAEEPDEEALSVLLDALPSSPDEACFSAWSQARIAAARSLAAGALEQRQQLQAAAEVLDSHRCIAEPHEWSLQRAEVLLLQAELAMARGQRADAQNATDRFRAHWPSADEEQLFVVRVAAVEHWLQAP